MNPLRTQFKKKDSQNRATRSWKKVFKDCARQEVGRMRAAQTNRKRGIQREGKNESCVTSDLAAAFCSCFILMASSLTGLGMKVMSAPSFTSRPIHQSLLYFCATARHTFYAVRTTLKNELRWIEFLWNSAPKASHLLYVQKVFGFKVNSSTLDWTVFIEGPTVTHIGFHCKCYWFRLVTKKWKQCKHVSYAAIFSTSQTHF